MLIEGIYKLLGWIDYLVYKLASTMISVNLDIAAKEIFDSNQIGDIARRIYIVIGVLMLFKVVISAIQYMINPDTFDDKEKGALGLLRKTAISIGLIVFIPAMFDFMIEMQSTIVESIPNVIFGEKREAKTNQETSDNMIFTVLSSFVQPNGNKGGKVGAEATDGIHDLESFKERVADGCGGGVIGNAANCKYDYMIIISTLSGGFLCYVLLSMTLDVAIRTIKFNIIRILAPIPISGYIFSKDKLSKFIKTTMTVYCDLFIRLAVIYFIIFAVEQVIKSNLLYELGGDDWFRKVIVNIAIIGGLFMFAKNAPKFISELLGLPDIGSGDMKDMFKPSWQRYGGMAGAAINPVSGAVANYRASKANGEKMFHRLRRAAAGAGRGAVDSAIGMASGDDWKKMRQRHEKATQKSSQRALAHYNKIKNREQSEGKKNALQTLVQNLKDRKEKFVTDADRTEAANNLATRKQELTNLATQIQNETDPGRRSALIQEYRDKSLAIADESKFLENEAVRVAAARQVRAKAQPFEATITNAKNEIANIDRRLAAGGLSADEMARLEARKLGLKQDITNAENSINNLTGGIELQNATAEYNRKRQTRMAITQDITNANGVINRSNQRIAAIDAELAVTTDMGRRAQLTKEKKDLNDEIGRRRVEINTKTALEATARTEEATAKTNFEQAKTRSETLIAQASESLVEEYNGLDKQIKDNQTQIDLIDESMAAAKSAIVKSKFSDVNAYFGGATPSGKGYMDLSSFLGSSRSSIYTGEAMTKMRQNADILVDINGNPKTYSSKYCSIPGKEFTYEEMRALLNDVQSSKIDINTLQTTYGFGSSAILQSAFEDLEKSAAADYINANIAQVNAGVRDRVNVRLKRPSALNSAVVEWFDDFAADLYKNGVSKKELDGLMADYMKDPGKFIQGASSLKDKYASIGKKIVDAQKPSDGGKK